MSNNRFAQIKDQFQSQPAKLVSSSYQRGTASPKEYEKKETLYLGILSLYSRGEVGTFSSLSRSEIGFRIFRPVD